MSKTQADRLGGRLKDDRATKEDLRLLDEYRRSFSPAYESVIGTLRGELGMQPTGRPAKSTTSITEKLKRESIRLTQIQDIAGCRVTVGTTPEQEQAVADLVRVFPTATVIDRRTSPSHGYRAVHVIVEEQGKTLLSWKVLRWGWKQLTQEARNSRHLMQLLFPRKPRPPC